MVKWSRRCQDPEIVDLSSSPRATPSQWVPAGEPLTCVPCFPPASEEEEDNSIDHIE